MTPEVQQLQARVDELERIIKMLTKGIDILPERLVFRQELTFKNRCQFLADVLDDGGTVVINA